MLVNIKTTTSPLLTTKIFGIMHIYVIGEPHLTTLILRSRVLPYAYLRN